MEGYLVQGDSADDQGGTLRTTVSAGVHQHRDEGYQKRDCRESVFITGDNTSGDDRRKHQYQKPRDSALCVFPGGYLKVSFFTWSHSRHLGDILGCLFDHDIHGVIECYDADQQTVIVKNRKCQQIVFTKLVSHFLFVGQGRHRDDFCLHDIFNQDIIIRSQQIFCRNDAEQFPLLDHITGIDGFFVNTGFLDMCECLTYRQMRFQIHVFGCHDTSGTVLRII